MNPLAPLSELAFLPDNGVDAWAVATGMVTLGFVLFAIDLTATLRRLRAPGMAWRRVPVFSWAAAICSWLLLVIGPVMLAAITMLLIDRNFDGIFFADGAGGAPLLWQHLSWIFYTGGYMLILITALAALAEIIPPLAGRPLLNRRVTVGSLAAIAVIGTLAWMQNMLTAPIEIGWMYFAMIMALALIVPVGLVLYNLIGTLIGGTVQMRAPLLFAAGAIAAISIGLAAELEQSMVAAGWQLKNTTDATAATHFALVGGAVFGGFAALHWWFPKMTGRTMGETLATISFWTICDRDAACLRPAVPCRQPGRPGHRRLQVLRRHRRHRLQPHRLDRHVRAGGRDRDDARQRGPQPQQRPRGRPRPVGGDSLEWFTLSPPEPHNFDVLPDVRSDHPMRDIRDSIGHRSSRADQPAHTSQPVA